MTSSAIPTPEASAEDPLHTVRQYHQRTKHRLDGYAKGPETLDWDNQPNPFRCFSGSLKIPLLLKPGLAQAECGSVLNGEPLPTPVDINHSSVSEFLRTSFGLAAWKQYGPDKWALRVNPSSGNLHPTEVYCLFDQGNDHHQAPVLNGLMHYQVDDHSLELRGESPSSGVLGDGFLVVLTSVLWRESWKYGERAFRYCQLDVGHALSCAAFAACALGWRTYWMPKIAPAALRGALGLTRPEYQTLRSEEGEHPDCCLYITRDSIDCSKSDKTQSLVEQAAFALSQINQWRGSPNPLGEKTFYRWPVINQVAEACETETSNLPNLVPVQSSRTVLGAPDDAMPKPKLFASVALARRSAQRFEPKPLAKAPFLRIVSHLLSQGQPLISGRSSLDFVLAIHNVQGLEPGLYVLPEGPDSGLPEVAKRWGEWRSVVEFEVNGQAHPLYHLKSANCAKLVASICCQQAIAQDCNFTVGYLARFEQSLNQAGSSLYRQLYWQAGSIAQQIYLAATYEGIAATGIGCYLDDPWHELLGIADHSYQLMYQMAVGHPIVDQRIASFSGYHHLISAGRV